jgi:plasmid stabilization system protein ParE
MLPIGRSIVLTKYSRCWCKTRSRERPDIRRDLRSFPVGSYVICYIPLPDGIEVVRVMHKRQDIDANDMGP